MAERILPNLQLLLCALFVTFAITGGAQTGNLRLVPGAGLMRPILQPGTLAQEPVTAEQEPTKISPWQSELHINVLKGDQAVNIVKRKSAQTVVVEVRDSHDTPVPGAMVYFSSPTSDPSVTFLNGERHFSTVTDGRGRASASGLKPVGGGSFQVEASVTDKAGTATADIAMTNFQKNEDATNHGQNASSGISHGTLALLVGVGAAAAVGAALGLSHGSSSSSGSSTSSTSTTVTISVGSSGAVSAPH